MKPASQVSPNQGDDRSFPLTDYSFQSTLAAPGRSIAVMPQTKARAFHKLSSDFFGTETHLDYVAELFFFILITAVAAWPILSMLACLARMKIAV